MKTKILFLLEDYNYFYTHETTKLLAQGKKYDEILEILIDKKYYQSDSLAYAFKEMGHKTKIVVPEANPLQLKWAKEYCKSVYIKWILEAPIRSFKSRVLKQYRNSFNSIQFEVLLEQVKEFKPDIIYFYSNIFITAKQIDVLKTCASKIVLQWTSPLWNEKRNFPYHKFDLIVTAAIQLKEYFDSKNMACVYSQQAFDSRLSDSLKLKGTMKLNKVIFIGNFTLGHHYRFQVLEYLLQNGVDITIYGAGKENLPQDSLVSKSLKQPLFGTEMYNEYSKYKIAIHIHTTGIENDGINWNKYAGAKRLFEITGSGTMLFTSFQENIQDLFEIDKEVITFKSSEELLEKIIYYLEHTKELKEIAERGLKRTIKDHSFQQRAKQLEPFLVNK